jgi:hypothetical protein
MRQPIKASLACGQPDGEVGLSPAVSLVQVPSHQSVEKLQPRSVAHLSVLA